MMKDEEDDPLARYYPYGVSAPAPSVATATQHPRRWRANLRHRLLWLAWLIVLGLMAGGLYYLYIVENPRFDVVRALRETLFSPVGVFGLVMVGIGAWGYRRRPKKKGGFFTDMSTELFSIAITVLALGVLVQWQDIRDQRALLIRDLGGETNDFAQRAARELAAEGWLYDGSLTGAYLLEANLTGANLGGANLTNVNFFGANLRDALLFRANLTGANLEEANLAGAFLVKANLTDTVLVKANLRDANFFRANLTGAFLGEANLTDALLIEANLTAASLGEANLRDANFFRANLTGAFLGEANLTDALLIEANLRGARMSDANLTGASLGEANLTDALFLRANLTGANLLRADLTGARYDNNTKWPEGFDPQEAGAINVD